METIIGIDPGRNGAIAVMSETGVSVTKMPDTPRDIYDFLSHYASLPCVAYLEDVGHGMPGQSSSATAKFARHNGHLEMALLALGIKTIKVTPNKWERTFSLGRSSDYTKTEWKNRLKRKAQELFPNLKVTLVNADALLICEYAHRQENRNL